MVLRAHGRDVLAAIAKGGALRGGGGGAESALTLAH